jgi:hypothetical protein
LLPVVQIVQHTLPVRSSRLASVNVAGGGLMFAKA